MTICMVSLLTGKQMRATIAKPQKFEKGKWIRRTVRLDNLPISFYYEKNRGTNVYFYLDLKWYKIPLAVYLKVIEAKTIEDDKGEIHHFAEILRQNYNPLLEQREMIKRHNERERKELRDVEKLLRKVGVSYEVDAKRK